jgi:hypothetical protein
VRTPVGPIDDLAEDWLSTGGLLTTEVRGATKAYPKRSELRRAEARAVNRRGADRRPAGGRPPGGSAGRHGPPAPVASGRVTEPTRRTIAPHGYTPSRLPIAVAPTAAVLPIQQTSSPSRPAGIDLRVAPIAPGRDAFHRPAPATPPMVPIAVPAPPQAPPELAAPVAPAMDPAFWGLDIDPAPATGRRRGSVETDPGRRSRRPGSEASVPLTAKLAGRGKAGAARLLVLALVVGAEGVAVTSLAGTAKTAPVDPSTADIAGAFEFTAASPPTSWPSAMVLADSAEREQSAISAQADALALAQAQSESSSAKVTAALAQAKAAADRVKAQAQRRAEAMRNAQRNPQALAKIMVADRGWSSSQFSCLVSLWNRESRWNYKAYNASSGAYGIPQALPGGKMESAGSDWRTNPITQMKWGLNYIADRYGTPCGAWGHSESTGWY